MPIEWDHFISSFLGRTSWKALQSVATPNSATVTRLRTLLKGALGKTLFSPSYGPHLPAFLVFLPIMYVPKWMNEPRPRQRMNE